MTPEEREYIRAYHNYLGALDDVRMIRETYEQAAMTYFQSLNKGIK